MTGVEICVESPRGLLIAQSAGADRTELCASLAVGGLTPSFGMMKFAAASGMPSRPLLRPRDGSFVYDANEARLIEDDLDAARDLGLNGVVIGAALEDGRLDVAFLERLIDRCGPLGRTLHRVFDLVPDPYDALECAISLGFDRILTSGQAQRAEEGVPLLRRLVDTAAGRIVIVAAGGVTAEGVLPLIAATGVEEVHASCRKTTLQTSDPALTSLGFGAQLSSTDLISVQSLVQAAAAAR